MAWKNAPGAQRDLPPNWDKLREECKHRAGGRCERIMASGRRCPRRGNEANHYGKPWEHHKLEWLCQHHHMIETQKQAQEARKPKVKRKRTPERPGRLR